MSDVLAILAFLVAAGMAALGSVLWASLRKLQRHQDGLYQEISALAVANKRLVERIAELEGRSTPLNKTNATAVSQSPEKRLSDPPQPPKEHEGLWQDVIFLAKQGLSADTIAKDLNITRGEVELILGLHNFKPKNSKE